MVSQSWRTRMIGGSKIFQALWCALPSSKILQNQQRPVFTITSEIAPWILDILINSLGVVYYFSPEAEVGTKTLKPTISLFIRDGLIFDWSIKFNSNLGPATDDAFELISLRLASNDTFFRTVPCSQKPFVQETAIINARTASMEWQTEKRSL